MREVEDKIDLQERVFFKVTKKKLNETMFVFIWDHPIENPPIQIWNKSKLFKFSYFQEGYRDTQRRLETGQNEPFFWHDLEREPKLEFVFSSMNEEPQQVIFYVDGKDQKERRKVA